MYSKGNKTCRRFVAILDESVAVTPPRNPALMFVKCKVFKYIGTKKYGTKGDVFLSTNTEGINDYSPCLVYHWPNYSNKAWGWTGSVILKILIINDTFIY